MKVVYMFLSKGAGICYLIQKVLPELETGNHGLEVVGMCFFDYNALVLGQDHLSGVRLSRLAKEKNIMLMTAESKDLNISFSQIDNQNGNVKSDLKRKPTECAVITIADGIETGCFPHLYAALADNLPDHVISL